MAIICGRALQAPVRHGAHAQVMVFLQVGILTMKLVITSMASTMRNVHLSTTTVGVEILVVAAHVSMQVLTVTSIRLCIGALAVPTKAMLSMVHW